MIKNVHVLGAGAWGTALAIHFSKIESLNVTLMPRRDDHAQKLNQDRDNVDYLGGHPFPEALTINADLNSLKQSDLLILVTPAQTLDQVALKIKGVLPNHVPVLIAAKGIKIEPTPRLLKDVLEDTLDNPIGVLSGPNFAHEIAKGLPAATTITFDDKDLTFDICNALQSKTLRLYPTTDTIGVQLGGALKNIYAIACGIVDGLNLGKNASAALITRCMNEMRRLGRHLKAQDQTFFGMSGMGDLLLTCSSKNSRNMKFGHEISQGLDINDLLKTKKTVTEGYHTTKAVHTWLNELNVDMPIVETVYQILYKGKSPQEAIQDLLNRPLKWED